MKKLNILPLLIVSLVSCTTTKVQEEIILDGVGFEKNESTLISSDINNAYAPANGEVKMLVVPICFEKGSSSKLHYFDQRKLLEMNEYYFGSDSLSLKDYYETASFNKVNVGGMISDIYYEKEMSSTEVNSDDNYGKVFTLIDRAVTWVQERYKDLIDFSEYDLNNDGFFDNIHLITNYESTEWAEPLWPHMFHTDYPRKENGLAVNVYSLSAINHMNDSITAIHEQGHIFGLQDYYDYGYTGVDYVGQLDMQDHNCFDWNSFSKYSVGWVNPYVYKGEEKATKITLKAASINGDCLVIPANYSSWNGSAFDEYFLIELFSPFGNNMYWWDHYSLGEYGVRMYHVDARLWGSDKIDKEGHIIVDDLEKQKVNTKEDVSKYKYVQIGATNCFHAMDYEEGVEQQSNYTLLQLIQRGGSNTFASPELGHKTLNEADLFKEGDIFTFEEYSKFLTKDNKKATKTNKGEDFPYSIEFSEMSEEEVTIIIRKIVEE